MRALKRRVEGHGTWRDRRVAVRRSRELEYKATIFAARKASGRRPRSVRCAWSCLAWEREPRKRVRS